MLDPGFGLNGYAVVLVLGITAGLVAITAVAESSPLLVVRHRHGEWGRVVPLPIGIVFALATVGISRLVGFEPGYLYGLVVGAVFARELAPREEARLIALSSAVILLGSGAAWLAHGALAASLAGAQPPTALVVLDAMLVATVVAGVEAVAFTLLPLRFLDGAKLRAAHPVLWAALLGVGTFGFVHVLVHPEIGL